jgi:hypothetical protein
VVNGEILQQGDSIMGMRVSKIDAANVTLTDAMATTDDIVLTVSSESGLSKKVVK